jgi:tetratricopeptide (TPR) repeat protein
LLIDLAETYHHAGAHERALAALDRLADSDRAASLALRGQALMALARWDEAAALYEQALGRDATNPALLFNLAYALMGADRDAPRARRGDRVLRLVPAVLPRAPHRDRRPSARRRD